jgi:DNA polymerase-3 subunit gamma/tau
VYGHREVVTSLPAVIERDSTRAFLLGGPSGVGKTTLARIIASMVGCAEYNILEVDAATHSTVGEMRDLTKQIQFVPLGASPGRMSRTIIVDEAHAMSQQAWKSLLKSVEEPGTSTMWVFCSTEVHRIPKTIRTRCVTYDLKPLSPDDMTDLAEYVLAGEKMELSARSIRTVVAASGGSPRRLLALLAACGGRDPGPDGLKELVSGQVDVELGESVALARVLAQGVRDWAKLMTIVRSIEDPPETIRRVVVAYISAIAVKAKGGPRAGRAVEILDAFMEPYDPSLKLAPLLVSLGRCVLV